MLYTVARYFFANISWNNFLSKSIYDLVFLDVFHFHYHLLVYIVHRYIDYRYSTKEFHGKSIWRNFSPQKNISWNHLLIVYIPNTFCENIAFTIFFCQKGTHNSKFPQFPNCVVIHNTVWKLRKFTLVCDTFTHFLAKIPWK